MRRSTPFRHVTRLAAGALGLALAASTLSACGGVTGKSDDRLRDGPLADLRIMVPNSAGGGYDITARTAAKVMEDAKITTGTEVFNLEGAGGTVGLARTVNEKGNADLTMLMGLGVVGASYTNKSKSTLADTTPIAKLIEEYGAVMVPKDSKFKTIDDLVAAWKADPAFAQRRWRLLARRPGPPVPDAARPGGRHRPDEGALRLLRRRRRPAARAARRQDRLRHLGRRRVHRPDRRTATSGCWPPAATKPIETVDAPTLKESGIDLVFTNWRGVVAPPGITDAQRDRLIEAFEKMHESPGVEGRPEDERLGRRVRDRGRLRDLPRRSRTSASPTR